MDIVTLASALVIAVIVYGVVGFGYFLASIAIWKSEWTVWWRRVLAAAFFPMAYFLDGRVEPELEYPLFGRHASRIYFWTAILTWPRLALTTGFALFLGFCRAFNLALGPPPDFVEQDEDE